MSIGSISACPGAATRNAESEWQYSENIQSNDSIEVSNHIINFRVYGTFTVTLNNCYAGVKMTHPEYDETVFSHRGSVVMNNCTMQGEVNAPQGNIKTNNCLIIGKAKGSSFPIIFTATEIRSRAYIKTETTPPPGFDGWIGDVKDSADAIYQFNLTDVEYYKALMVPNNNTDIDSLTHFAILTDDDDIECMDGCKIYGDIINNRYCREDEGQEIKFRNSMTAGSILNNGGNTILDQSSAKAVYSLAGLTEINNSTVDFIYTIESNVLIDNHSVIRQGAVLGGRKNEILSSTINGSVTLQGQTLTMWEESVIDQVCLPPPGEIPRDFIPCITLKRGATLHALETHGQPCHIYISEGGNFTPLNRGESLPANVVIKDL